jgi:hypothetical protein
MDAGVGVLVDPRQIVLVDSREDFFFGRHLGSLCGQISPLSTTGVPALTTDSDCDVTFVIRVAGNLVWWFMPLDG